jgi:hypothetical protein
MNKFDRMKGLSGLASNPPQPLAALTDERMRDLVQQQAETIKKLSAEVDSFEDLNPEDIENG